jgi:DNA-binding NtrC family response regulator
MTPLPLLLIIDDLFGRTMTGGRNEERANLCGQFLLRDVTGDEGPPSGRVKQPVARAVFCRGQTPPAAAPGDVVRNDLEGTLAVLRDGWERAGGAPARWDSRWALVLLDLCFYTGRVTRASHARTPGVPEGQPGDDDPGSYFGIRLLEAIRDRFPDVPVAILSSQPKETVRLAYHKLGALKFFPRTAPNGPALLRDLILQHGLVPDDGENLADPAELVIGHSVGLLQTLRSARRLAAVPGSILIRGERGCGKELVARYVARWAGRANPARPYVVVNSGGLTPDLYESTLFGHRIGAFTGANSERAGKILLADGGDLFLDEVGNMPARVQGGVLRVIEYGELVPVGSDEARRVAVRFLSATNSDLDDLAANGRFRPDLLDRLRAAGTLYLRPLRDRMEDLPLLVENLVRRAERANPAAVRRVIVEDEVVRHLQPYDWPGNVRELAGCITDAVNQYPDAEYLLPLHLRLSTRRPGPFAPLPAPAASPSSLAPDLDAVIAGMASCQFGYRRADLDSRLPRLMAAFARLVAGYLRAALEVTGDTKTGEDGVRRTEIALARALRLITGNEALRATQPADLTKRLLALDAAAVADLVATDPLLKAARDAAVNNRPTKPKARELIDDLLGRLRALPPALTDPLLRDRPNLGDAVRPGKLGRISTGQARTCVEEFRQAPDELLAPLFEVDPEIRRLRVRAAEFRFRRPRLQGGPG